MSSVSRTNQYVVFAASEGPSVKLNVCKLYPLPSTELLMLDEAMSFDAVARSMSGIPDVLLYTFILTEVDVLRLYLLSPTSIECSCAVTLGWND